MNPVRSTESLPPHPEDSGSPGVLIRTRDEKQALDWSLVLASQEIPCAIRTLPAANGWALEIDPADVGRALRTLRLYKVENRRWRDAFQPKVGEFVFHWGVLLWCLLMTMLFWADEASHGSLDGAGDFDTALTAEGQFWRPLTGTFLHSGPEHLAANLTTGFLLLGLAMGRFGVGITLLISLVAGVLGNLFAWAWRPGPYHGLGASGVVMGALGMLAVSIFADVRTHRLSPSTAWRGALGGIALFILFGTAERSDVLAHLGGFLGGAFLAIALLLLPPRWLRHPLSDPAAAGAFLALSGVGWLLALR